MGNSANGLLTSDFYGNKAYYPGLCRTMATIEINEMISKTYFNLCVEANKRINNFFNTNAKTHLAFRNSSLELILNEIKEKNNPFINENYELFQILFSESYKYFNYSKKELNANPSYLNKFAMSFANDFSLGISPEAFGNDRKQIALIISNAIKAHYPVNEFPSNNLACAKLLLENEMKQLFDSLTVFFAETKILVNELYTFEHWAKYSQEKYYADVGNFDSVVKKICRGERLCAEDTNYAFFSYYDKRTGKTSYKN